MAEYNSGVAYIEIPIPADLLDDPSCPREVIEAVAAVDTANDLTDAREEDVFAAKRAIADAEAAIMEAAKAGKPTPKGIEDERTLRARVEVAEAAVRAAGLEALEAAQHAERAITANRAAVRRLLVAHLADAHADAREKVAAAQAADAKQRGLGAAIRSLDATTAQLMGPRARRIAVGAIDGHYVTAVDKVDPIDEMHGRYGLAWEEAALGVSNYPADPFAADPYEADYVKNDIRRALQAADRAQAPTA